MQPAGAAAEHLSTNHLQLMNGAPPSGHWCVRAHILSIFRQVEHLRNGCVDEIMLDFYMALQTDVSYLEWVVTRSSRLVSHRLRGLCPAQLHLVNFG